MTQAIPARYALAADLIEAGRWRIAPETGLVYGCKGNAFRRTNSWGYIQIKFRDPADWHREYAVLAHRVIWEYVHGLLAPALTINHMNGAKTDNRLVNLEAVTMRENMQHARRTGLNIPVKGEHSSRAQLTDTQVREIYLRAWTGRERSHIIAADYDVERETVSNIKNGWTWSHVTGHAKRR